METGLTCAVMRQITIFFYWTCLCLDVASKNSFLVRFFFNLKTIPERTKVSVLSCEKKITKKQTKKKSTSIKVIFSKIFFLSYARLCLAQQVLFVTPKEGSQSDNPNPIYSATPLRKDMTQGQFLSRV